MYKPLKTTLVKRIHGFRDFDINTDISMIFKSKLFSDWYGGARIGKNKM